MPRLPVPGSDAGQWGTTLNEFLQVAHGDDGTLKNAGFVNARWFGATGDGVTDDTAAIQAALDAACPLTADPGARAGTVLLPRGTYLITDTLNMTNTREPLTRHRDGLRLVGESMFGSTLLGRTGGKAMVDMTGAQWAGLEHLHLVADTAAPAAQRSTVGVFTGIFADLPQTQNQVYRDIYIVLFDDMTANGGLGTVAFWNVGAEENTHDHIFYVANRPIILSGYRTLPGVYAYPQRTILDAHSLGVTTFTGECFLQALGNGAPAIHTVDVNSLAADNLYINGDASGSYHSAIRIDGGLFNSTLGGTIEGFATALDIYGALVGSTIRFQQGFVHGVAEPVVRLRAGQGWILNSHLTFTQSAAVSRPLVAHYAAAASEAVTCHVAHSTLTTDLAPSYAQLPPKVLWNPKTLDVTIAAAGAPAYRIATPYEHQLALPRRLVRGHAGDPASAAAVRLHLPTILANASGQTLVLDLEGMLAVDSYGTNAGVATKLLVSIPIVVDYVAGAISSTVNVQLGAQAANRPAGNSITGVAVTLVPAADNTSATVVLAPVVSGANNEAVYFMGTARLYRSGHPSDAAYLAEP